MIHRLALFAASLASTVVYGQTSADRSQRLDDRPVRVSFSNLTNDHVTAFWIDYDGIGREIGVLFPNQTVELTTFPGHTTVFSAGSRQLATFRATSASGGAFGIVGPGGSLPNPRPSGGASSNSGTGLAGGNPGPTTGRSQIGNLIQGILTALQDPASGGGANPGTIPGNPANPTSSGGSRLTPQAAQELVDFHNRVRRDAGVGLVAWDADIAKFAQDYADRLAIIGQMVHNPNAVIKGAPLGENLAWGSTGANWTVVQLADGWESREKSLWKPGSTIANGPNPAGHYTQMIWKSSTVIGAGLATGPAGTFLVCNYSPAGNIVGQKPN